MTRFLRILVILAVFASTAAAQQKKRVAVFDFDFSTVQTNSAAVFGTNVDIGKGISDLIVESLVKSGTYSVIERKAIEKILAEQNFSNSDRADASSAAKIGKILGVDAIIIGSITQFGNDDKATNVGGGALGGVTGRFGIGGVSRRESKAVVNLSARMVSTDTAEILGVAAGKAESKRSGTSLLGAGGSSAGAGGAGVDMSSSNFAQTIIGEAVIGAVAALSTELDGNADKIVAKAIVVDGLVADATDNELVLNIGTKGGVKVGDKLAVKRVTREVKDPATGKVIRRIEDSLGTVTITEADEGSSVGTYTGSSPAKVGDRVVNAQ
ncbi:MAG: curli production assembly protein CsgG [Acidobacteria bacterium]|nr:curli production assembly protein CsgG [Acidobacteriota bacterium]